MTDAERERYFQAAFRDWQSGVAVIPYVSLSPEEAKARFEEAEREMRRKQNGRQKQHKARGATIDGEVIP